VSRPYILRGQIAEFTETQILAIDPARTGYAFRIVEFYVAGQMNDANDDVYAKLSSKETGTANWNWNDSRELAWASTNMNTAAGASAPYMVIDPQLVISDLWINGNTNAGAGTVFNYWIKLERVTVSDDMTVLGLIKERAQND
jgi:hypothetical protein